MDEVVTIEKPGQSEPFDILSGLRHGGEQQGQCAVFVKIQHRVGGIAAKIEIG